MFFLSVFRLLVLGGVGGVGGGGGGGGCVHPLSRTCPRLHPPKDFPSVQGDECPNSQ